MSSPRSPSGARRVVLHEGRGRLVAQEGADQVDVDDLGEELARHRAVLAEHAAGAHDAGAVDEQIEAPEVPMGGVHRRIHFGLRGHVAAQETCRRRRRLRLQPGPAPPARPE